MLTNSSSATLPDGSPRFVAGLPDEVLLQEIRQGNERAFDELVERHHAAMIRLARVYVSPSLAEEVAQETWIAIIKGLQRFEGRAAFKTWMFRILVNRALSHSWHEGRGQRFLNSHMPERRTDEPVVDPSRFYPPDHPLEGQWLVPPRSWTPEERLLGAETRQRIEQAIDGLPLMQRQVITLRDVEGWSAREVCDLYGITEANQRVLLHRARMKIRNTLEQFVSREEA